MIARRSTVRSALAASLLLLLSACALQRSEESGAARLAQKIREVLDRPELRGTSAGIEIRRLSDGALLFEQGADLLLPPASATKLVSCAAALELLGKDFRFETRLVRTGEVVGGTLRGDLVLVASGDPNLSQRVTPEGKLLFVDNDHTYAGFIQDAAVVPGDPLAVLQELALQTKQAGIDRIEGAVVVDDGLFQAPREDAPDLSAACVNDNRVDVIAEPAGEAGKPPVLKIQPQHPEISVENSAITSPAEPGNPAEPRLRLRWLGGIGRFELSGTIPAGSKPVLCSGALRQPALAAAHFLAAELARQGIAARDPPRRESRGPEAYADRPAVAKHLSPPLSEAIRVVLKVSHNLHADMLPCLLGAVLGKAGTEAAGYRVIRDFLRKEGLDADRVQLQDGSGLGRADCLSARFLVSFLRKISSWKEWPALLESLPAAGVDGTLSARFRDPSLRGRVRAKTGTLVAYGNLNPGCLYRSKALAGYLDLGGSAGISSKEDVAVFAILFSNHLARSRREGADVLFQAQEDILRSVLEVYGRPARP